MRQRVAWSRDKVAEGHPVATVARIANISRQAIYKTPKPRTKPQSREICDPTEQRIVDTSNDSDYQTDGYRMIAAIVSKDLGRPVNRERVLRIMRKHKLIQRRRRPERRRRSGKFRVTRPNQPWHLDMTSVWVAEHGWTYLMAIIDTCTREIVGWQLTVRCRAKEAKEVIERSVSVRGIVPDHPKRSRGRCRIVAISLASVFQHKAGHKCQHQRARVIAEDVATEIHAGSAYGAVLGLVPFKGGNSRHDLCWY